jgi:predicted transporter
MNKMALFYYWTWFVWPFLFVFSFAFGIAEAVRGENTAAKNLLVAAVSLLLILAGVLYPALQ